ncbi:RNA-binding S4 domain-containing protein [Nitrosomonas sp. JL21]|uniref:RNA-binding S4 domain-containing protein n=1 Tax=Nitrosomonas sp. JL21 TaxID=153949 RepID=UPI00136F1EF1|nr:RNA-binding S4 domain-containing protein [Nitrosomonas sp. JL21]MBL8496519.1 RNA-binding S4 domain-containing protein [Nitrosomonas sp.]MCC7092313.1 RNA-binding S4 domain-containing protein [Nitrosomonas sp.]MXS76893.1 RNA-binding S4 domain-containing protein [Nitrosomonas sp. JL21]
MQSDDSIEKFRIDKWLFAARFFKTRSLAAEAVERGRVSLNDQRVKPAKTVAVGDMLTIRIGSVQYVIEVLALSNKRGSAPQAQQLYRETDESKTQRESMIARLKAQPQALLTRGRPTKRNRRKIEQFISDRDEY